MNLQILNDCAGNQSRITHCENRPWLTLLRLPLGVVSLVVRVTAKCMENTACCKFQTGGWQSLTAGAKSARTQ